MEDITVVKEFLLKNLPLFKITEIKDSDLGCCIDLRLKKKQTLAEYCVSVFPHKTEFKSNNQVYSVEKFYINVKSTVKVVFVLRKGEKILNVISLYECEHPDLFANEILNMTIDEIITEE